MNKTRFMYSYIWVFSIDNHKHERVHGRTLQVLTYEGGFKVPVISTGNVSQFSRSFILF